MTTTAIGSTTGTSTTPTTSTNKMALSSDDFIKMMVTQLQNQDPLQPTNNSELLAQMSQIGQLQSATDLQTSLKSMVLQNQIGSAGNLIGKVVSGTDDNNQPAQGLVTSVKVGKDSVMLELDSGQTLPMANVATIAGNTTAQPVSG